MLVSLFLTGQSDSSSANFPNNEPLRKVQKICGILVLVAAGLLGAAGGMTGKPEEAAKQSKLSKIAYFEFLAVLVILVLLCVGMYVVAHHKIRKDHLAVRSSPFLPQFLSPFSPDVSFSQANRAAHPPIEQQTDT
jgi:hypothetical protein